MLVIVCKVADLHIKVDGLMVRRLVSEAETVNALVLNHKLILLTRLVAYVVDLLV